MRAGRLLVTFDLLASVLGFQADTVVRRVDNGPPWLMNEAFWVTVEHRDLDEVPEGAEIPQVDFVATRIEGHFDAPR